MKIAEVDDAIAVKRLRKVVVLYFDAIHVGSPHALVDSPRGKNGGDDDERGKYTARRPHGNAYLRKVEQIAQDVKRKRQHQKQHHRRIYPPIAQDYGRREIRRELVAANSRKESELAKREGKQCGRGKFAAAGELKRPYDGYERDDPRPDGNDLEYESPHTSHAKRLGGFAETREGRVAAEKLKHLEKPDTLATTGNRDANRVHPRAHAVTL